MEDLIQFVHLHADSAPWIVFGLLMLAGLNIPVSEDAMILCSALLATERPDLTVSLFIALYAGAYLSDLVCYWMGRTVGPRLWSLPLFERVVPRSHVQALKRFYDRYGMRVLLIGRFIPFGVRNGLLLTAGLSKMSFVRLALVDLLAATLSCSFYFWLYMTYGRLVIQAVATSQLALLAVAGVVVALLLLRRRFMRRLEG